MVFLVEDFVLLECARIFPSSGDLAGSRLASNSRLDARPGGVAGRLSEEEMMGLKRLMKAMSLLFSM
jgi:hypothetical protein